MRHMRIHPFVPKRLLTILTDQVHPPSQGTASTDRPSPGRRHRPAGRPRVSFDGDAVPTFLASLAFKKLPALACACARSTPCKGGKSLALGRWYFQALHWTFWGTQGSNSLRFAKYITESVKQIPENTAEHPPNTRKVTAKTSPHGV